MTPNDMFRIPKADIYVRSFLADGESFIYCPIDRKSFFDHMEHAGMMDRKFKAEFSCGAIWIDSRGK